MHAPYCGFLSDMSDLARRIEVQIGPLRLAVLGRVYPGAHTQWDADRLLVEAVCVGTRSRVEASGDIMPALSFRRFTAALKVMHSALAGEARLETYDPYLKLVLRMSDGLGHVSGRVEITSPDESERHSFAFAVLDQTDLPSLISQMSEITDAYPSAVETRDGV